MSIALDDKKGKKEMYNHFLWINKVLNTINENYLKAQLTYKCERNPMKVYFIEPCLDTNWNADNKSYYCITPNNAGIL